MFRSCIISKSLHFFKSSLAKPKSIHLPTLAPSSLPDQNHAATQWCARWWSRQQLCVGTPHRDSWGTRTVRARRPLGVSARATGCRSGMFLHLHTIHPDHQHQHSDRRSLVFLFEMRKPADVCCSRSFPLSLSFSRVLVRDHRA